MRKTPWYVEDMNNLLLLRVLTIEAIDWSYLSTKGRLADVGGLLGRELGTYYGHERRKISTSAILNCWGLEARST